MKINKIAICCVGAVALLSACGGGGTDAAKASAQKMSSPLRAEVAAGTFTGVRNNYTITKTSTGVKVTSNTDGTVTTLDNSVQSLKFSDVTVNLAIGNKASSISASDLKTLIELYLAYFNRVPDAEGLSYWIDQFKAGQSLEQIGKSFYDAAVQYSSLTGYSAGMTNADFVKIVYKNVLGRTTVDQEGLDYWTKSLASGAETRGTLIKTILGSAHTFKGNATYGQIADLLDNKGALANYFAVQQGLSYNSSTDSISKGMAIASAVTASGTAAANTLIGVKDTLFNLAPTCMVPAVLQNGACVMPESVPIPPSTMFEVFVSPGGDTYVAKLCWGGTYQCETLGQSVFVSAEDILADKGEVDANVREASRVLSEFNNMIGRMWKAKTYPPTSTMVAVFTKAISDGLAAEDGSVAISSAAAGFTKAGYPAASGGSTTTGGSGGGSTAEADAAGSACSLSNYKGPNQDPQFDSFCKNAYVNTCLDQTTGTSTYQAQTQTVCKVLDGFLKAVGSGTAANYCGYCR
ncbi:DUF4214 domain-containing protein [Herbaspirillum sp. HC18]|nr:DUF4214 domain-containing protein [Herbaspirillum sp. HC18]